MNQHDPTPQYQASDSDDATLEFYYSDVSCPSVETYEETYEEMDIDPEENLFDHDDPMDLDMEMDHYFDDPMDLDDPMDIDYPYQAHIQHMCLYY
ncbi:unnamed protein product [Rhizopus stolonifer]